MIMNKIKNFFPSEVIAAIKVSINLTYEFKIFGGVDRPAVVAKVGGVMEQGDIMEGYVVDVAGNYLVERAMDLLQNVIEDEMASQGMKITNRYSPGYCEWDIREQQKLFSLFPENYLDVSLTDSCLMQPIKTVSGVIGIGKDVKLNPYTCHYCTQANCLYRDK